MNKKDCQVRMNLWWNKWRLCT